MKHKGDVVLFMQCIGLCKIFVNTVSKSCTDHAHNETMRIANARVYFTCAFCVKFDICFLLMGSTDFWQFIFTNI